MNKCPLCEGLEIKKVHSKTDAFFTNGTTKIKNLEVSLCTNCGFVFQSSAYKDEYARLQDEVYENYTLNTYFTFPRKDSKTIASLEFLTSNLEIRQEWNVLEIGSDRGDFLHLLKSATGCNILGIEANSTVLPKVPTISSRLNKSVVANKFELIIFKQTLEHILDPKSLLYVVGEMLSCEGYVYVEVPSFDWIQQNYTDDFIPDHVSHFSKNSLIYLFEHYSVHAFDNSYFLRIIFSKKQVKQHHETDSCQKVVDFFSDFVQKKEKIEQYIIELSNNPDTVVVFYGVGLYFRSFFADISQRVNIENCFFIDDNFGEYQEPVFGLTNYTFADKDKSVLVIGCSNDFFIQEQMKESVKYMVGQCEFIHLYKTVK